MALEEIRAMPFGFVNGYVVKSDGHIILIDTGVKGKFKTIERTLAAMGFDCTDIHLVMLTHTHQDHTGNVAECKKTSDAEVLVHSAEADVLRNGKTELPAGATGFGKFIVALGRTFGMNHASFDPVEPDIVLGEGSSGLETYDLHSYGFPGIALYTPSHSAGSLSFLTDDGVCFPGDIIFNIFFSAGPPLFADNSELLLSHWRALLERGAQTFYPAHGKPFGARELEERVEKMSGG